MPQRPQIAALVRHERKLAVGGDRNHAAEPRACTNDGVAAVVHTHPQRQPHVDAPAPPGSAVRTPTHAVRVLRRPDVFRLISHGSVPSKRRPPSVSCNRTPREGVGFTDSVGAPVGTNATTAASQPAHRGTTTRPRPRVFPATKTAQAVFDRRRASPPLTNSTRYALSRGVQLQTAAGTSGPNNLMALRC